MQLQVLPATAADVPALNPISYAAKAHWGYPAEWMERWRPELELTAASFTEMQVFKLLLAGAPIGWCAVVETPEHYEVEHLWILPGQMGNGYGKLLLNEALAHTVQPGKPILVLSDPNAEGFYQHQGFVTFEQQESYPPGRFLPLMRMENAS